MVWLGLYLFCWPMNETISQPTVAGAPTLFQLTWVKKGKRGLKGPKLVSLCHLFPFFALAQTFSAHSPLPRIWYAWLVRIVYFYTTVKLYAQPIAVLRRPSSSESSSQHHLEFLKRTGTIIRIWVQSSLFQFLPTFLPFYFRARAFSIYAYPCLVPCPSPSRQKQEWLSLSVNSLRWPETLWPWGIVRP